MSLRLVEGLIFGKDTLPQYAGTRQRVLSATFEFDEAKKPTRILRTEPSVWVFDQDGGIRQGLHEALALAMDILPTPARDGTVVELRPRTKKQKLEQEFRWEPGKAEIDRVISDIWPKRKADRLKAAEGVAKRKPPLTYDASRALDEASEGFWKIEHAIERLKEPSLKGFCVRGQATLGSESRGGIPIPRHRRNGRTPLGNPAAPTCRKGRLVRLGGRDQMG